MPTRNVVLTHHQHQVIESLIGSGRYPMGIGAIYSGVTWLLSHGVRWSKSKVCVS